MNITDIIALLALFVALYSAVLSTYTAINEFFRLKLSILNRDKTFFTFTKSDTYLNEYGEYLGIYKKNQNQQPHKRIQLKKRKNKR